MQGRGPEGVALDPDTAPLAKLGLTRTQIGLQKEQIPDKSAQQGCQSAWKCTDFREHITYGQVGLWHFSIWDPTASLLTNTQNLEESLFRKSRHSDQQQSNYPP